MDRFIAWESALERDFDYLVKFDPTVISIEERPILFINASGRKYTPDAGIALNKQSFIFAKLNTRTNIVEFKYCSELHNKCQRLKPKFKLAINECQSKNWKFNILTAVEIRSTLLENVNNSEHHMRRESETENEARAVILAQLKELGVSDIDP